MSIHEGLTNIHKVSLMKWIRGKEDYDEGKKKFFIYQAT